MRICFLTQTATDISPYYKEFFKEYDLFFLTFKVQNPNAVTFLPKSSWSDGRNKLWDEVKGKYDYYVFMDDDLLFYNFNHYFSKSPVLGHIYHSLIKRYFKSCYQKAKPARFITTLKKYLEKYKPEVMSVFNLDNDPNELLDRRMLMKNSFVRRLGYFDAQFTVLSDYAANKLLPYDTKFSGWWSSQIPIYIYSYNVFASKALNLSALAVSNSHHVGAYVPQYNGIQDCKNMLEAISKVTNKDYVGLAGMPSEEQSVNMEYGEDTILKTVPKVTDTENYKTNFENYLKGVEKLFHQNMIP